MKFDFMEHSRGTTKMHLRLFSFLIALALFFTVLPASTVANAEGNISAKGSILTASSSSKATAQAKKIKIEGPQSVAKGKKITLTATVTPENASQKVSWSSSNKKIATVTSKGVVKGVKAGTVKITATAADGSGKKATVKITVQDGSSEEGASSNVKYRALLIGNGKYYNGQNLLNYKYNIAAMKGMLTKALATSYTVNTKTDCTAQDILSKISNAFSGAKENDVSLFYYFGHGMEGNGSLVGVDGSTVNATQLRDALLKVPGKVIVILDSCFSGMYIANRAGGSKQNSATEQMAASDFNQSFVNSFSGYTIVDQSEGVKANSGALRTSKFIVLTACQWNEVSYSLTYGAKGQGYSFFAKSMFNGIGCAWPSGTFSGSSPCDSNKDGIITLGECASYIRGSAVSFVQTCAYYGNENYKLFRLKK